MIESGLDLLTKSEADLREDVFNLDFQLVKDRVELPLEFIKVLLGV
jgi:hypothetical protein